MRLIGWLIVASLGFGASVARAEFLYPVIGKLDGFDDTRVIVHQGKTQFFIDIKVIQPKRLAAIRAKRQGKKLVSILAPSSAIHVRTLLDPKGPSDDDDDAPSGFVAGDRSPAATPLIPFDKWYFHHERKRR